MKVKAGLSLTESTNVICNIDVTIKVATPKFATGDKVKVGSTNGT